jgi:hypothetical protein
MALISSAVPSLKNSERRHCAQRPRHGQRGFVVYIKKTPYPKTSDRTKRTDTLSFSTAISLLQTWRCLEANLLAGAYFAML